MDQTTWLHLVAALNAARTDPAQLAPNGVVNRQAVDRIASNLGLDVILVGGLRRGRRGGEEWGEWGEGLLLGWCAVAAAVGGVR